MVKAKAKIGRPVATWFGEIVLHRPDEAREIFLRKLREHHGSIRDVAAALAVAPSTASNLVTRLNLSGVAREIRERQARRFRLPAA